jgi:hypothetical protein
MILKLFLVHKQLDTGYRRSKVDAGSGQRAENAKIKQITNQSVRPPLGGGGVDMVYLRKIHLKRNLQCQTLLTLSPLLKQLEIYAGLPAEWKGLHGLSQLISRDPTMKTLLAAGQVAIKSPSIGHPSYR